MTLESGTKLGLYEILAPLGAGGMGEVYRAKDTKLDRDVAIKVLPAAMTSDPERVARFEREAKLLASLNHPLIAAIHGFDQSESKRFLVMEYVEGETLAQRLRRGALPLDEAVVVGRQTAEALEAAHLRGVVHRDLKPGNVMLRPDGVVKVLDFGLAKAVADDPSGSSSGSSPTITADYTRPGVVLGTAAYMSPEQARGKSIDTRADLWSLGVLLYECVAGERLFRGENATDTIGAILHREIELDDLPETTPGAIRHLLRRCLQRDPHQRLQSAGDARIELEELARQIDSGQIDRAGEPVASRRNRFWPAMTALLAIALIGVLLRGYRTGPSTDGTTPKQERAVTELVQLTFLPGLEHAPSLSPDGKMLLYVARDGSDLDIFLQRVGGENAINLTADSAVDDYDPAFSPDGERIAFRSQREGGGLFVMGATGESPRRVSDAGFDPAWSPDGRRLVYTTEDVGGPYSRATVASLWTVDLSSREKSLLTHGDAVGAVFSPSGRRVAFWAAIAGVRDILTISTDGGEPRPVTQDAPTDWNPFFSPDGRTLYFISDRSGTPDLWCVAIDEESGQVQSAPRPVTAGATAIDQAAMTADGRRIAFTSPMSMGEIQRYEFDAQAEKVFGDAKTLYQSTSQLNQFDVTRDGRRLAYRTGAPREDIVVMNVDGTGRRRLMDDVFRDRGPHWTPDGSLLLFYSNRGGLYDIWCIHPDGTDARRITSTSEGDLTAARLSRDGRYLAVSISLATDLATVVIPVDRPLAELRDPLALPEAKVSGFGSLRFSPDSRYLAGYFTSKFGALGMLTLDAMKATQVLAPDGGDLVVGDMADFDWIDENRFIVWDSKRNTTFVCNMANGQTREVTGIQGPCDIRVVENGTALITNRTREEADIWMLTLGEISEAAGAQ